MFSNFRLFLKIFKVISKKNYFGIFDLDLNDEKYFVQKV